MKKIIVILLFGALETSISYLKSNNIINKNIINISSIVVTPKQIYNEFSSGVQDVSAIRDFLRFLYKRSNSKLK